MTIDLLGEEVILMRKNVPVWEKAMLTLEEASDYTGIGLQKLRDLSSDEQCDFVLWNGSKRMFKRRKLVDFLEKAYSIYAKGCRVHSLQPYQEEGKHGGKKV